MPTLERLASHAYADRVNTQWVKLLSLLEMNVSYERRVGTELFTTDGRRILDFLSRYCVHNVGHNHAAIVAVLKDEFGQSATVMLQSNVPELAGELAKRLCKLARGELSKAFFAGWGSEGVETAIKFTRSTRAAPDYYRTALLRPRLPWSDLRCAITDEWRVLGSILSSSARSLCSPQTPKPSERASCSLPISIAKATQPRSRDPPERASLTNPARASTNWAISTMHRADSAIGGPRRI